MDEYIKGSVSGIIQILSGHPFDTMKVQRQNNMNIPTKNIIKLYKGISFPLITNSVVIGSQFYLYHNYSGIIAGIVSGLMITPIDYFKIQKQMNINYKYKIKIPKGFNITIMRETLSVPIYFNSYYYINERLNNNFLSGGLAGMLSWLITYPIDTIKTRIQNESCKTIKEAISKGGLNKGMGICLTRAFIVNGINFSVYEKVIESFEK